MNLNYVLCKCKGFGYARSLSDIKMKKILNENDEARIVYFHAAAPTSGVDASFHSLDVSSFEELEALDKQKSVFIVELGFVDKIMEKEDVCLPEAELFRVVDEHEINLDISDEAKGKYKDCLKSMIEKPVNFLKAKYNATFLEFLKQIYPSFEDSRIQKTIISILNFNGERTDTLVSKFPIKFNPIEGETTKQSPLFSDLKINDPYFNKSQSTDTESDEILRRVNAAKISQFNGFGDTFSRIDNSKTTINHQNNIPMRNYEVINMLTRNKIVSEPQTIEPLSLDRLMKTLEKYDEFKIVFIWPEYPGFAFASVPTNVLEVSSDGCVILNVVFRYICIYFFGMYSIYNDEDKYNKYLV